MSGNLERSGIRRGEAMESARQEVVKAKIRFSRGLGASFEANRTRAICKVAPATSVRCCRWRPAAMMIPLQPPGSTSVSARSRLAKRCFASGYARPARTLALRARLATLARARPLLRSCGSLEFLPRRLYRSPLRHPFSMVLPAEALRRVVLTA